MEHRERILVGILTNPASGRDIRRLVSCASLFPTSATVAGMAAALCATGMIDHQSICRRNKRLNGEREIEFGPDEFPLVWLDPEGPMTVNVRRTLDLAAGEGLLRKRPALLQ